jgi:hypothetical protein
MNDFALLLLMLFVDVEARHVSSSVVVQRALGMALQPIVDLYQGLGMNHIYAASSPEQARMMLDRQRKFWGPLWEAWDGLLGTLGGVVGLLVEGQVADTNRLEQAIALLLEQFERVGLRRQAQWIVVLQRVAKRTHERIRMRFNGTALSSMLRRKARGPRASSFARSIYEGLAKAPSPAVMLAVVDARWTDEIARVYPDKAHAVVSAAPN